MVEVRRGRVGEAARLREDRREDQAGLDERDADPEGLHLLRQGLARRLEGVLDGGVVAVARGHEPAGDRAHVDDRAAPARAHAREHRTDHPDRAEVVRLEERLRPLDGDFLDRAAAADPGVVDQDVHAAGGPEHLAHAPRHRRLVVHVERDGTDRELLLPDGLRQLAGGRRTPQPRPDFVAPAREVERGREADAAAGAGDQDDGHGNLPEPSYRVPV